MKKIWFICLFLSSLLFAEQCENKSFSLSAFGNITLMDIVKDVSKQCEITVLFEDMRSKQQLSRPIDMINIKDYSLEQLFSFLFEEHNLFYTYDKEKNIIKVSYYETRNIDIDYINMSELKTESVKSITVGAKSSSSNEDSAVTSGEGSNSDFTSVTATSTFTFWDKLKEHLGNILEIDEDYNTKINQILVDRDAAIVTVTATKRQFEKIQSYLKKVESRMHAQVMIESYLIELTYEDSKSRGVDWSKLNLTLNPNVSYDTSAAYTDVLGTVTEHNGLVSFGAEFSPTGIISFLDDYGDVEVLSNPKVLTLNNQPAVINVGKQLSYLYQDGSVEIGDAASPTYLLGSIFVGLTLNIIPEITEDDHIIMRVNPVTSELLDEISASSSSSSSTSTTETIRSMPPDTRIKQMSSIVKVKDGQRVIIGGLIEKTTNNDNSKVPLLGDLPLLGSLFSHKGKSVNKSELFILIIPKLIKNSNFPTLDDAIAKRIK